MLFEYEFASICLHLPFNDLMSLCMHVILCQATSNQTSISYSTCHFVCLCACVCVCVCVRRCFRKNDKRGCRRDVGDPVDWRCGWRLTTAPRTCFGAFLRTCLDTSYPCISEDVSVYTSCSCISEDHMSLSFIPV